MAPGCAGGGLSEVVRIGNATLILGDAREVLPTLSKVDLCLTDPPYGIGKDGQTRTTGGHGGRKEYEFMGWDEIRPSQEVFALLRNSGYKIIIWGCNYFADMLPSSSKWLLWDKGQRINQSDGELAWTNMDGALRICTLNRVELMLDGAEHPTQKPVRLMKWCIDQAGYSKIIIDPFAGSFSTGVAAVQMGRQFIGIERNREYFRIGCERIERAQRQSVLFPPEPMKAHEQMTLETA